MTIIDTSCYYEFNGLQNTVWKILTISHSCLSLIYIMLCKTKGSNRFHLIIQILRSKERMAELK
jgi:hypothetical protein